MTTHLQWMYNPFTMDLQPIYNGCTTHWKGGMGPEQVAGSREWRRIVLSSYLYAYMAMGIYLRRSRDGDAIIPCSIRPLPFKQRPRCLKGKRVRQKKHVCKIKKLV